MAEGIIAWRLIITMKWELRTMRRQVALCVTVAAVFGSRLLAAESGSKSQPVLKVPDGFSIELVAGPPLTERPIVGSFDDAGRLYVAESSGTNDPVQKQLEELPHRISRLEDTDGDGKFDKRTLFADRMMFPEGALFHGGSLYVSAPPSIWKLTDTNGDGVADQRSEWFQGKTLTGCANDLHGPYLGPDGWIYWCKGAFAEQTHQVNGREWTTRAAHVFRCRPDGSGFEPVMTSGMDNPVDVVFTPDGERILSGTYFVGGSGRRDGLAHIIYGGVYGKDHGVLDGHPRTGELMPTLAPMGAAAPCGLERYESDAFGPEYRDNLFLCQFNLRRVSRHVLRAAGSTFVSEDSNFVTSENVDFHPTDVLMDADGSLIVIDTGGWYKLCCPTSQLWKPDVLGGIYRVRRIGETRPADPRGQQIDWSFASESQLWSLLSDARPAVRQRATREFARRSDTEPMRRFLGQLAERGAGVALSVDGPTTAGEHGSCDARTAALARTWAVGQTQSTEAKAFIRHLFTHDDEQVRHVAAVLSSLHRDKESVPHLLELLQRDTAANRRTAAEALGRIGDDSAVPHLLSAAAKADDRILRHSITYALIELDEPAASETGLASAVPGTVGAALMALDQMPSGAIKPEQVIPRLNSSDEVLRDAARWLVTQHTEWGGELAEWFRKQLADLSDTRHRAPSGGRSPDTQSVLESMLVAFARHPSIQQLLAETIARSESRPAACQLALRVVAQAKIEQPPTEWRDALADVIGDDTLQEMLPLAVAAARTLPPLKAPDQLDQALTHVGDGSHHPTELRVAALSVAATGLSELNDGQFELLTKSLSTDNPVTLRSAAADGLSRAKLTAAQLEGLCNVIETASPLELSRLLAPFSGSRDERLGLQLLSALRKSPALASLRIDLLRETLASYGPTVARKIDEVESLVNVDAAAQRRRLEELLPHMSQGDIRRGHAVYYSNKAACSACHRLGHAGELIGPELTRIGETRTERDLLESILYPSLSFVQSFEPVMIVTVDGRTINGAIRDQNADEVILTIGADQEVRVDRDEIEEMLPSKVSIMPTGLDAQLTTQELADLVAFLKNAKGG
jgi:putative membrane-bound dehydrogenase-like protein